MMKNRMFLLSILLNVLFLIAGIFAIQKMGGIQHLIYKIQNRGLAGTYMHRINLFEVLPEKDSSIVFLGDSITAQCEWSEMFDKCNIINRGIPGDATDGVLKRLSNILKNNPQKIFLMIGVNDLFFHDLPHIIENYRKIVTRINNESPQTKLFIQSVLPINNNVKETTLDNKTIIDLNNELQKIASINDLTYIDLFSLFIDENKNLNASYTQDGIHLNGQGYMEWKKAINKHVIGLTF